MENRKMRLRGFFVAMALAGAVLAGCASGPSAVAMAQESGYSYSEEALDIQEHIVQSEQGAVAVAAVDEVEVDAAVAVPQGDVIGVPAPALAEEVEQTGASPLSQLEAAGTLFMREVEKLARDIYLTLYGQWGTTIFQNIAGSEQQHMDAVATLINRYGLTDPVAGKAIGEFENAELQELYDLLQEQGSQSLAEALKVGSVIEEIDILDLQDYIAQTERDDIRSVYENLLKGSWNHLRSFVSLYEREGQSYQPQYLSQADYDGIINSSIESGRQGQGRRGGRP